MKYRKFRYTIKFYNIFLTFKKKKRNNTCLELWVIINIILFWRYVGLILFVVKILWDFVVFVKEFNIKRI